MRPNELKKLEALVVTLHGIHQELAKQGVAIPDFPTTRSSVAAWLMEEGMRTAVMAMAGVERIRTGRNGNDDIAIVETSPLWHSVLYHWPKAQTFPAFPSGSHASDSQGPVGQEEEA
jgi:hypothetical protein